MLLVMLLIGHMMSDFFLQSSKMAENKQNNTKVLIAHSGIYFLVFASINLVFLQPTAAIWPILIISCTHLIIDFLRTKVDNRVRSHRIRFWTFLMDQILHLLTIVITYYSFNLAAKVNSIYSNCESHSNFNKILMCCLLFAVLLDPTAVFIKKSFAFLFREEGNNNSGNNAGTIIGKLERIIIAILLLCNQYGVIGLVLTAKSIARFKQLEDRDFAEKYLIGTLLSLSIALILTIVVKYFLSL